MTREVLVYPDSRLKKPSLDIIKFDTELHMLLEDMKETMYAKDGIGLAAIQIGVAKNVLIINIANEDGIQDLANIVEVINPQILESEGEAVFQEGCLSVPDFYEEVTRSEKIKVSYFCRDGIKHNKEYEGMMAIAFQHELDHLRGHLFVEKLSYLKRKKFEKEWKKKIKEGK